MAVNVRIPEALRTLTDGADVVEVDAGTVKEMIDALEAKHNGIKERICSEDGQIRRFVNIFVSEEDIRFLQNQDTPLASGTEVSILPAIAGGAGKPSKKAAKKKSAAKKHAIRRVYLTFRQDLVTRPVIYELVKKYDILPNIRGASVTDDVGIISVELEGKPGNLEKAFSWLRKIGVKVDPIEMNVVEP